MPFTYGCFIVGGLALAGVFPFSGLWSKDEILSLQFERGGWHDVLGVLGYIGAFMTAVYTFRMIFRAFHGEPCEEARELEHGHLAHHDTPTNPATGEVEDDDVGFPGEHHHIAEREGSMQIAMAILAIGAIGLGFLQIPGVTHVIHTFLEPTFADSSLYRTLEPSDSASWVGLLAGTGIGLLGIGLAYRLWVMEPTRPAQIQERLKPLHTFFVNKWYFDELIDLVVVRPFAWFGRFAYNTFERLIVDGVLVGGTTGVVRAGSAAVRALQSGFLRAYAALLVLGLTGVGLYFLISAS
jgi:NADH-quinone oxidoreductase subunit L